jgi:uncharacterized protein GlcG (DUF336 family)
MIVLDLTLKERVNIMSTRTSLFIFLVTTLFCSQAQAASDAYVNVRVLSMELANKLALEANLACRKMGYQVTTTVVDRNGNLLAVIRDPLSGTHTIDISMQKAKTAATFQTDTISMVANSESGGLRFTGGVAFIGGGIPVKVGGHFYGAIGVSGAPSKKVTGDIDDECARKGLESIQEAIEFAE